MSPERTEEPLLVRARPGLRSLQSNGEGDPREEREREGERDRGGVAGTKGQRETDTESWEGLELANERMRMMQTLKCSVSLRLPFARGAGEAAQAFPHQHALPAFPGSR